MVVLHGRQRRALALFVATVAVFVVGALPQAASADQVSDKQAQANAIAAKIDELNHTIERYAEQANGAQVELNALDQQVQAAQAKVDAAKAQQAQHQGELRAYAIDAYVHGTDDQAAALDAANSDLAEMGQRQGYLAAAAGNRQQLIDQLRATEEDVQIQIGQLNDAQAKAQAKANDLNSRKSEAASAASEQKKLLEQTQGELATLVKAAQAKKAADEAAAAAARVRTSSAPSSGGNFGPAPSPNGGAGAAIAEARRQLGKPYEWGAAGPDSFDCSGLTMWAWRAGGVSLPHYTGSQYQATTHVPLSAIQPGDLIFYNGMEHVALYVGGGTIIHAPHSGDVVKYDSLYYWNTSMVASRP